MLDLPSTFGSKILHCPCVSFRRNVFFARTATIIKKHNENLRLHQNSKAHILILIMSRSFSLNSNGMGGNTTEEGNSSNLQMITIYNQRYSLLTSFSF